ncbi:type II secretion system F family protein [Nesterenkonia suensis]
MTAALLLVSAGALALAMPLLLIPRPPGAARGGAAVRGPVPRQLVRPLRGGPRAPGRETGRRGRAARRRRRGSVRVDTTRDAAMLIRQLSALLQSGRGPGQAWEDLSRQWAARQGDGADRSSARTPGAAPASGQDHPLAQLCARAAAADRAGRGAADGLERFAAELRAGLRRRRRIGTPASRLTGATSAAAVGIWPRAAAHDVPAGPRPGASTWGAGSRSADQRLLAVVMRMAGLLRLSEETGAPLSRLAEELATTLDDDVEVAAAVSAAVAGPRLTQRVLAGLPIGGLLVGQLIGADVLGVLLGTAVGLGCLTVGAGLMLAGVAWSRRMIQVVESHG